MCQFLHFLCACVRVCDRVFLCIRGLRNTSLLPLKIDFLDSENAKNNVCVYVCTRDCACMIASVRVRTYIFK